MKSLFHHCIVFASAAQNERKIVAKKLISWNEGSHWMPCY